MGKDRLINNEIKPWDQVFAEGPVHCKVVSWNRDRGFGFVNINGERVFVHSRDIGAAKDESLFGKALVVEGITHGEKGYRAGNVWTEEQYQAKIEAEQEFKAQEQLEAEKKQRLKIEREIIVKKLELKVEEIEIPTWRGKNEETIELLEGGFKVEKSAELEMGSGGAVSACCSSRLRLGNESKTVFRYETLLDAEWVQTHTVGGNFVNGWVIAMPMFEGQRMEGRFIVEAGNLEQLLRKLQLVELNITERDGVTALVDLNHFYVAWDKVVKSEGWHDLVEYLVTHFPNGKTLIENMQLGVAKGGEPKWFDGSREALKKWNASIGGTTIALADINTCDEDLALLDGYFRKSIPYKESVLQERSQGVYYVNSEAGLVEVDNVGDVRVVRAEYDSNDEKGTRTDLLTFKVSGRVMTYDLSAGKAVVLFPPISERDERLGYVREGRPKIKVMPFEALGSSWEYVVNILKNKQ